MIAGHMATVPNEVTWRVQILQLLSILTPKNAYPTTNGQLVVDRESRQTV